MFSSYPNFLLRTPLQPLEQIDKLELSSLPAIFEEGVYGSAFDLWKQHFNSKNTPGKEPNRIKQSFLKYWIRSCTRATPFATFAGITLGSTGDENSLLLDDNKKHRTRRRIDTNYLYLIINAIVRLPQVERQLKYYPNTSLYRLADCYRFVQYFLLDTSRQFLLKSVDKTPYIDAILARAEVGATFGELIEILVQFDGVDNHSAVSFLRDVLQLQILVSELEPLITGIEPFDHLLNQLEKLTGVDKIVSSLKEVQTLLKSSGSGIGFLQTIENHLATLDLGITPPKNTIQTDLFLSAHSVRLQSTLVDAIAKQANDLRVLSKKLIIPDLDNFARKFFQRYESEEIPLALALDSDKGIGYSGVESENTAGSEWIDTLFVASNQESSSPFDYIQQFTLGKYDEYLKKGYNEIEITDEDIRNLRNNNTESIFSNGMYLLGSLYKRTETLDHENFIFDLKSFDGPSAARIFGRFTHGSSEMANFARSILRNEEQVDDGIIYAEIVHLPEARIGNILLRPILRDFEIPYLGASGAERDHQISVEDLMVSVINNQVTLRSKRLNKQIVPCMTTAHNFRHSRLPIYKFLCDLQFQGLYAPGIWDWGNLTHLKQLPRVTYKNIILRKAQWNIDELELGSADTSIKDLVERRKLPNVVVLCDGDNELVIRFDNKDHIALLQEYLKKKKSLLLQELLITTDNAIVKDINGNSYANEIIIPLKKDSKNEVVRPRLSNHYFNVRRKFPPNSEWLYFKLYCGQKEADNILVETVLPFVNSQFFKKQFEKFFFIRFRDELPHLRLRFYNSDLGKQKDIQAQFIETVMPLIESRKVESIQIDTYIRELERYDPRLIDEAETLFFNDSYCILNFLGHCHNSNIDDSRYRILFALRAIDTLLDDFRCKLPEKRDILKRIQSGYFQEFGANPILQKQLNEQYRKIQKDIFTYLNPKNDVLNKFYDAGYFLRQRAQSNMTVVPKIIDTLGETLLFNFISSNLHMCINRIFLAQQRKYELLLYHFMEKYYTSLLAIERNQ